VHFWKGDLKFQYIGLSQSLEGRKRGRPRVSNCDLGGMDNHWSKTIERRKVNGNIGRRESIVWMRHRLWEWQREELRGGHRKPRKNTFPDSTHISKLRSLQDKNRAAFLHRALSRAKNRSCLSKSSRSIWVRGMSSGDGIRRRRSGDKAADVCHFLIKQEENFVDCPTKAEIVFDGEKTSLKRVGERRCQKKACLPQLLLNVLKVVKQGQIFVLLGGRKVG